MSELQKIKKSGPSAQSLDCCGHLCPVPILMTEEKMEELRHGDLLEVAFTDPGARADLEAWCSANHQEFLRFRKSAKKMFVTIRKNKSTSRK